MYLCLIEAASFRRTIFLTRIPKGTGRFLMRRLADLIYWCFKFQKKNLGCVRLWNWNGTVPFLCSVWTKNCHGTVLFLCSVLEWGEDGMEWGENGIIPNVD